MGRSNGNIRFMAGSLKSGRPAAWGGTLRVIDSRRRHENQPQEEKMKTSGEGGKMATKFLLSDGCVMARRRIIKVCEKLVRRNSCVRYRQPPPVMIAMLPVSVAHVGLRDFRPNIS
jgi:hypothetical protein